MSGLITLLIIFGIWFRLKKNADRRRNVKSVQSVQNRNTDYENSSDDYERRIKKAKNRTSSHAVKRAFSESNSSGVIRDEKNDWLSRQIEEEKRAQVRVSDMLGLKRSHEMNCDAKALKREHLRQHGKL